MNQDDAQSSTTQPSPTSKFILPLRSMDPEADQSSQLTNQKYDPRSCSFIIMLQKLFKSSPNSLPAPAQRETAEGSRITFDRLFMTLPMELQVHIVSSLSIPDILNLRLASKWWHALITLNEVPIAHHLLDNHIPTYAQRLYPVLDQSSISLHYICALWHRLQVAQKLSYHVSEYLYTEVFDVNADEHQPAFAVGKQRLKHHLIQHLFHMFHFFENYRTEHVEFIKRHGHGLLREPYTLNPIEVHVMAMYDDSTLWSMKVFFGAVIDCFCQQLRPPSYIGIIDRSLGGPLRQKVPDEICVAIMCVGGLRQVARIWEVPGYNERCSMADAWYASISEDKGEVKSGFELGSASTNLGQNSIRNKTPDQGSKGKMPSFRATINSYEDTNLVFSTSMSAGMPMGGLNREQLRILLPDLPILQQIWSGTAKALIENRGIAPPAG